MRAHTPWQEAEPVAQVSQVEAEGIADRALEPAVHAGAHAAQHHAVVPCLAQRLVHAVHAPDGQHVRGVAAADVDDVLIADERPPLHAARGAEQLQVRRPRAARERLIEEDDVSVGVAARGPEEEDARVVLLGERQHVVVEPGGAAEPAEAASTETHDSARQRHGTAIVAKRPLVTKYFSKWIGVFCCRHVGCVSSASAFLRCWSASTWSGAVYRRGWSA